MKFNFKLLLSACKVKNYRQLLLPAYLFILGVGLVYLIIQVNNLNKSVVILGGSVNRLYDSNQVINTDPVYSAFHPLGQLGDKLDSQADLVDSKIDKLDTDLSTQISDTGNHLEGSISRVEGTLSSMNKTLDLIQLDLLKLLTK